MNNKFKVFFLGILFIAPQIVVAQSCSKESSVPGVTSLMRSRANDFKNAIETKTELGLRSSVYIYASRTVKKYIDNPQDLVAKLVMLGFTDVYIAYDKPTASFYIPKSWYLTFNKLAHENGIFVHALSLSNLELYVSDQPIKDDLEWINEFNNSVDATQRFDGISADLEPHILKAESPRRPNGLTLAWQENYGIGNDNDLLLKRTVEVMALAKKEMGSLTLNQALGFFVQSRFDTGLLSWGGAQQFLQHCDQVIVMAYNYQPTRVIEMATPVLTAAAGYPKSVSVGVKTSLNTLGDDGPLTSFQPQGWNNLISSIKYILAQAKKFQTFRGLDIFEFGGLEIMWESTEYDVFLLIGQSNMAGRGTLLESDYSIVPGVYLLNFDNCAEPASNPFNKYSTIRKDLSMQQMSPAYSFGKRLHEKSGRNILLVVNARGGTTIEEWSKDNLETNYYSQAVERTKAALKFGKLTAIIWHQGEGDSEEPSDYLSKLSAFVKSLREDLGCTDVPFIAGEIAPWWLPFATNFNAVIREISTVIPNSAYITAEGTKTVSNEKDPHFNRESQIILGERYAAMVLKMCYRSTVNK